MNIKKFFPRRIVFALTVFALAGAVTAADTPPAAANSAQVRVVIVRNPRAISERDVCDRNEAVRLFDRALAELTGAATAAASWKALGIVPTDVVAVKINCNNWTIALSPKPELIEALCRSLLAVVPANQIIVYDNEEAAMKQSGFFPNRGVNGVRFTGTDHWDGFDAGERLTRIVSRDASKIINLASMKCVDKDFAVSLLLKNHIGSLIPADMSKCHDDPDFLAGVCARPSLKKKTVLNIITGLRATYQRGVPWYWAGLIMSRDPLAAETAAIGVINEKRKQEGLTRLALPAYLAIAENKYKLGTCATQRIELIKKEI
jgi:hypothetical protein